MHKENLIALIIEQLQHELSHAIEAANNAHLAATDDQSVAETQYDTLAIEAAYLAEGQTKRVAEIKKAISAYQQLQLKEFDEETPIALGAMVQLAEDVNQKKWYFIGPASGGVKASFAEQNFTVITPQSPIGQALLGKYIDDELMVTLGSKSLSDNISNCY